MIPPRPWLPVPPPCGPAPLPYYEEIYVRPDTMPHEYSEERISRKRRVVEESEDILRVNHFGY